MVWTMHKIVSQSNRIPQAPSQTIMSLLRRLSCEMRQVLLNSSKQSLEPLSVNINTKTSFLVHNIKRSDIVNKIHYQDFLKCDFHTSSTHRDIEAGMKALGGGLSMIGAIGAGSGIGHVFGGLVSAIARNPSLKDQLFIYALMGAAFCETICLFCFVVSMIILNT